MLNSMAPNIKCAKDPKTEIKLTNVIGLGNEKGLPKFVLGELTIRTNRSNIGWIQMLLPFVQQ